MLHWVRGHQDYRVLQGEEQLLAWGNYVADAMANRGADGNPLGGRRRKLLSQRQRHYDKARALIVDVLCDVVRKRWRKQRHDSEIAVLQQVEQQEVDWVQRNVVLMMGELQQTLLDGADAGVRDAVGRWLGDILVGNGDQGGVPQGGGVSFLELALSWEEHSGMVVPAHTQVWGQGPAALVQVTMQQKARTMARIWKAAMGRWDVGQWGTQYGVVSLEHFGFKRWVAGVQAQVRVPYHECPSQAAAATGGSSQANPAAGGFAAHGDAAACRGHGGFA